MNRFARHGEIAVGQRVAHRYSVPSAYNLGRLPLAPLQTYDPGRSINTRLLTFRARAADRDHAASTPDTTWASKPRAPAGSSRDHQKGPRFRCHLTVFRRLNSARPPVTQRNASGTSSRSPPDAIKSHAVSLDAHHDGL